jgi:excisionase family DNA binding protein
MDTSPHDQPISKLVSRRDARALLGGISNQTLYRLIAERSLRLVKVRRRSFIRRDDIDALIEAGVNEGDHQ